MENSKPETSNVIQTSVERLLADLPAPVQKFLTSPERDAVSMRLSRKYNLHVDQAGAFEEAYIFMLLGVYTPQEFIRSLKEAQLEDSQINGLITDVNEEVFVRLRAEERKESAPVAQSVPPRSSVPIYSPLPVSSTPSVPPSRVQPPPNLPGQMPEPPAPRPVPPPPHIEVPTPPPPIKITGQPAPESDQHARIMHTMARDMAALKSGADPLRVAHPAPPAWAEAPNKPVPIAPPPAPVIPPQPQAPKSEQSVVPAQAPVVHEAPQPQEALRTHLKQYGVDPYREPVE